MHVTTLSSSRLNCAARGCCYTLMSCRPAPDGAGTMGRKTVKVLVLALHGLPSRQRACVTYTG